MGLIGQQTYSKKTIKTSHSAGQCGRRIVKTFVRNGREYQYHATKGWRSYRVAKDAKDE